MGYSFLYIIIYTARVPNFNQNQRKDKKSKRKPTNLPKNLQNDELMQETYQKIRMLFKELDKVGHGLISRNDFYKFKNLKFHI